MVFNESTWAIIIIYVLALWVFGLSIVVFGMVRHYNRLSRGVKDAGLKEILEGLLDRQKNLGRETKELFEAIAAVRKDGMLHIQRVGLVRFNPFSDTGGAQSFTLALIDGNDNGLVMTSLYARTGHRWYIKEVIRGKGKELALSREETQAVQKAKPFAEVHL